VSDAGREKDQYRWPLCASEAARDTGACEASKRPALYASERPELVQARWQCFKASFEVLN
jgi:hypothetical protein